MHRVYLAGGCNLNSVGEMPASGAEDDIPVGIDSCAPSTNYGRA